MLHDDPLSGKLNWGAEGGQAQNGGAWPPRPPWHCPWWWWWEFNYK